MPGALIIVRRSRYVLPSANAINSSMIIDGEVKTADLATLAVTDEKIESISGAKIVGEITTATIGGGQIANASINAAVKIESGTVGLAQLSSEVLAGLGNIADRSLSYLKLQDPLGGTLNMGDANVTFSNMTSQHLILGNAAIGTQQDTQYFRSPAAFAWYRGGTHSDTQFDPGTGGTMLLRLDGEGSLIAKGDVLTLSDERIKSGIRTIDRPLERLEHLRGCLFHIDGRRAAGVLAQDVQIALPEAVRMSDASGTLAVAYPQLIGLLVEAVKQLHYEVEDMRYTRLRV